MWQEYHSVTSIEEALQILAEKGDQARIVAGATDLILELERGQRKGITTLIDVSRIPLLDQISLDEDGMIHLGPLVTHNLCAGSKLLREMAFPLVQAAWEVGSPQIRNRGTIAGNLITASPANDTISPLMALGARLTLKSLRGERVVPLAEFYTGVRRIVMQPDEMLVDIAFPEMTANQKGTFIKFALRRAQAISLVNISMVIGFDEENVRSAAITLGAVAPTILHAKAAEEFLVGKKLDEATILHAAELTMQAARPISDVRGSAGYRRVMVRVVAKRALTEIVQNKEKERIPVDPVLLMGKENHQHANFKEPVRHDEHEPIVARVNGKTVTFRDGQSKTLLRLLREDGLLIGTKEGCAEGECGACTVFLDGQAVMACMVPAPRAHGAEIVTIEGIAPEGSLHPVQQAFVDEGAVQCGYCTPGFVMSAVKLLEERPTPTQDEIRQALTGNLCRCTGYYKIIEAIEKAGGN